MEWKHKEGAKLIQGDYLCSVETDKATVDFQTNEDGFLAKIFKDISIKRTKCYAPFFLRKLPIIHRKVLSTRNFFTS